MKNIIFSVLFILATQSLLGQELISVEYKIGSESHTGYYALPKKVTKKTKTVLIVHEWWGLNYYPKSRALQLAKEGNIAFCIDMYGTDKIVNSPGEAQALAMPFYQDPNKAYRNFMAGYDVAVKIPGVKKEKMIAIGYCFGGSMVLNAAKMSAPIDAAVSFHGGLAGIPVDKEKLSASILVCNGAADSFVSPEEIAAFKKDMTDNNVDLTFIDYADATHAFTNAASTAVGIKYNIPISYNAAADKKSWVDFKKFMKAKVK